MQLRACRHREGPGSCGCKVLPRGAGGHHFQPRQLDSPYRCRDLQKVTSHGVFFGRLHNHNSHYQVFHQTTPGDISWWFLASYIVTCRNTSV